MRSRDSSPSPPGEGASKGRMRGFGFAIDLPPEDVAHVRAGDPHPAVPATLYVEFGPDFRPDGDVRRGGG